MVGVTFTVASLVLGILYTSGTVTSPSLVGRCWIAFSAGAGLFLTAAVLEWPSYDGYGKGEAFLANLTSATVFPGLRGKALLQGTLQDPGKRLVIYSAVFLVSALATLAMASLSTYRDY